MSAISLRVFSEESPSPLSLTLLEFFERVYRPFHNLEERTQVEYLSQIKKFSLWYARGPDVLKRRQPNAEWKSAPLQALNDETVGRYVADIRDVQKSLPSARKARVSLLSFWKYAVETGNLATKPERVQVVKLPKRTPTAWRIEEFSQLLNSCHRARTTVKTVDGVTREWDGRHWRALLLVLYDTSMRIRVTLTLKVSQVDLDRALIYTNAEDQKHDSDESYKIHVDTVTALRAILGGRPRELVFDLPFCLRHLWRHFNELLELSGLPNTFRDKFHKIRRTTYTYTTAALGKDEAGRHAGHAGDLSSAYLDQRLLREITERPEPANVIPRPTLPGGPEKAR